MGYCFAISPPPPFFLSCTVIHFLPRISSFISSEADHFSTFFFSLVQFGVGKLQGPSSWPSSCPQGFAQHLAAMDAGCAISYCVALRAFNRPPPLEIKVPPYGVSPPKLASTSVATLVITSPAGDLWKKDEKTGHWELVPFTGPLTNGTDNATDAVDPRQASNDFSEQEGANAEFGQSPRSNSRGNSGLSDGRVALATIVVALATAGATCLICLQWQKYQRRKGYERKA